MRFVCATVCVLLVVAAGTTAPPRFVVENKCPRFVVVNNCPADPPRVVAAPILPPPVRFARPFALPGNCLPGRA